MDAGYQSFPSSPSKLARSWRRQLLRFEQSLVHVLLQGTVWEPAGFNPACRLCLLVDVARMLGQQKSRSPSLITMNLSVSPNEDRPRVSRTEHLSSIRNNRCQSPKPWSIKPLIRIPVQTLAATSDESPANHKSHCGRILTLAPCQRLYLKHRPCLYPSTFKSHRRLRHCSAQSPALFSNNGNLARPPKGTSTVLYLPLGYLVLIYLQWIDDRWPADPSRPARKRHGDGIASGSGSFQIPLASTLRVN